MRVRWVLEDVDRPGGVEKVVRTLHRGLEARGVDSSVTSWRETPSYDESAGHPARWLRGRVCATRDRERAARETAHELHRELLADDGLVVVLDPGSLDVARHLADSPRWGIHVHWSPELILSPWRHALKDAIPRAYWPLLWLRLLFVARRNRRLLGSAPFLISLVASHTHTLLRIQPRVHQIPNPVDALRGAPRGQPFAGPVVLGYVGRLSHEKGPDVFVEALARLAPHDRQGVLIAGSGPLEEAIRAQLLRHGLTDVHLLGWVADPRTVLERIDVLVFPSRVEALGLVLVEALAAGCVVVAAEAGSGVRDVLRDGALGAMVPTDDPAALAEGILEASLDVKQGRKPDPQGVSDLVEEHAPDRVTGMWVDLLHQLTD